MPAMTDNELRSAVVAFRASLVAAGAEEKDVDRVLREEVGPAPKRETVKRKTPAPKATAKKTTKKTTAKK